MEQTHSSHPEEENEMTESDYDRYSDSTTPCSQMSSGSPPSGDERVNDEEAFLSPDERLFAAASPSFPFEVPPPPPAAGPIWVPPGQLNCRRFLRRRFERAPRRIVRRIFTNSRERWRQQNVNGAFADLRRLVPTHPPDKKLSKNEILRLAIRYIKLLSSILHYQENSDGEESKPELFSLLQHHQESSSNSDGVEVERTRLVPKKEPEFVSCGGREERVQTNNSVPNSPTSSLSSTTYSSTEEGN